MANFNKHLKVGAIVGAIAGAGIHLIQYYQEKERNPDYKFSWGKFLLYSLTGFAMGAIIGIAPDKIEPASNPNHRGFFHSYSLWCLLAFSVYRIIKDRNNEKIWKYLAIIGFVGYSSHLMLDMETPKSLPILGI